MAKRRRAVHARTDVDGELFLRSLDDMTPDAIAVSGAAPPKRRGGELVSFLIDRAVYVFAVCVFAVCVAGLIKTLAEQIAGDIYYDAAVRELSASYSVRKGPSLNDRGILGARKGSDKF